ncbi:MAG TPA: G/U mismatch-specific DNA glycosylase [Acidimicrobiales bacterium]|nr:G/U mismatch-specific DNA glycosylase [Acidimicrobiales bacterium]
MSSRPGYPTPADLAAAEGKSVPDVIAADLDVLFCGVNPGLWTAAVGHHFARPGNRFWKALHLSGFTDRLLSPDEERLLLEARLGITNLVDRASRSAGELTRAELRQGAKKVTRKISRWRPAVLAVLGMSAYRSAFDRADAGVGLQPDPLAGSRVWLLPNPSGLQAHYQLADIVEQLKELRAFVTPARREPA